MSEEKDKRKVCTSNLKNEQKIFLPGQSRLVEFNPQV